MQICQKVDSLYPKVQFEIPNDSEEYELFNPSKKILKLNFGHLT